MTAGMVDIMGSSGLAWHQWRKHGTCSGLSAGAFCDLSRRAYQRVQQPAILRQIDRVVRLSAAMVEAAFLAENPDLTHPMLTVTCRDGQVQEVRICLTRALEPRDCAPDVARDCPLRDALFAPMRQGGHMGRLWGPWPVSVPVSVPPG